MAYMIQLEPMITPLIVCIIVGLILRKALSKSEEGLAMIPLILAICGGVWAYVAVQISPEQEGLHGYVHIAEGVVSGLAASGCYQLVHQHTKIRNEKMAEAIREVCRNDVTDQLEDLGFVPQNTFEVDPQFVNTFIKDVFDLVAKNNAELDSLFEQEDSDGESE